MRVADATIKQLLANETSMTRDSMLAYVDELSDDRVVANDVVTMLEIDGFSLQTRDARLHKWGCLDTLSDKN